MENGSGMVRYLLITAILSLLIGFSFGIQYRQTNTMPTPQLIADTIPTSAPPQRNEVPIEWRTYTNRANKPVQFSFEYPQGWNIDIMQVESRDALAVGPSDEGLSPFIIISYLTTESISQQVKTYYCGDPATTCEDEQKAQTIQISGLTARKLLPKDGDEKIRVIVKKGESLVSIDANLGSSNSTIYTDKAIEHIYEHIISSLNIE